MEDVVDELVIIKRLPRSGKLGGDALYLGKVFVRGEVILARVVEGRMELLDPSLGLSRDMGVERHLDRD
jgi:hypothetical protein